MEPIQAQPSASNRSLDNVASQPSAGQLASVPGLEYLANLDKVLIKQQFEFLEACFGCETQNSYLIKDFQGRDLFFAKEDSNCCYRQCCGNYRPFVMHINAGNGVESIRLTRKYASDSCWCPCCLQEMKVFCPPDQLIGTIIQTWSCKPRFSINDVEGNTVLKIKGPCCTFSCCCRGVDFKIFSPDGSTEVGLISKKWSGLLREAFTDADIFGVSFPLDLDVRMKALVIGACLLIDFMYFEEPARRGRNNDA